MKARIGARRLVESAAREARAIARLAWLLPHDLDVELPAQAMPGDDVAVLVHGTLATAGAWRPLRARLASLSRVHTASFTYGPTFGVAEVAEALGTLVRRLPEGVRIHLVGHSLGGLGVRWFIQEQGGERDPRVVQTVALGAPFEGARGARLFPGPAGRDMSSGSASLASLASSAGRSLLPHLSVFGASDTAVDVATRFPVGERVVIPGAGHNGLLFDDRVTSLVAERVRSVRRHH